MYALKQVNGSLMSSPLLSRRKLLSGHDVRNLHLQKLQHRSILHLFTDMYQLDDSVRAEDKVIVLTGANAGIGKYTALDLAKRGARLHCLVEHLKKLSRQGTISFNIETRKYIIKETGNNNITPWAMDLSDMASVRRFAKEFSQSESRIDVLINNAACMESSGKPRSFSKDGHEITIAVNYFAPLLLTNLLMDLFKKSAPSRIVNLGSIVHSIAFMCDLQSEKFYNPLWTYAKTKQAIMMFTFELAKRLEGTGVTVNCCHPGVIQTELFRVHHLKYLSDICFDRVEKVGHQTSVFLALDPSLDNTSGGYYWNCEKGFVVPWAKRMKYWETLWSASEEATAAFSKPVKGLNT